MINDLPEVVLESTCLLYAIDLKLVREVGIMADLCGMQTNIDSVVEWSHRNRLHFKAGKCSLLSFSHAHAPRHLAHHMRGKTLQRVTEVGSQGPGRSIYL
ncbi:unnamed protein product [Euphydryas editha]|uniref:Uncharacterized protein n=1 Tax=Euphydryas editha TaxID=104508 RepID=A0AAU9UDS9_EUPED|nr:unnamed protein product [Euphydryas editha]